MPQTFDKILAKESIGTTLTLRSQILLFTQEVTSQIHSCVVVKSPNDMCPAVGLDF